MRPIDADVLENMGYELHRTYRQDANTMVYEVKKIADVPTIEVEPNSCEYWDSESHFCALRRPQAEPVHGRWINTGEIWTDMYTADEDPIYKCSVCNEEVIGGSKHFVWCPSCGAKMENERSE